MKVLIVVDMQNDFIDGTLGTKEAVQIVPKAIDKIKNFDGLILATRDTHSKNYLETQEGKKLPVEHCIYKTKGWEIQQDIQKLIKEKPVDKPCFGSLELIDILKDKEKIEKIEEINIIGLCTDICVVSNALLIKSAFPEIPIIVDSSCCAGVTVKKHESAIDTMKSCQIEIM